MRLTISAIFISIIISGCSFKSPLLNLNSIYDTYTISKDERGIYAIIKDNIIQKKIQTKILATPNLSNFHIDVVSQWGEVLSIGAVATIEQEKRALWYALHTDGVSNAYSFLHILK